MANFLLLFRNPSTDGPSMSPEEMQQHTQKWVSWMRELSQSGHFQAGEPLERSGQVLRGKDKVITDGPYAESKDLVGGYLIVTAESLAHAVELAKGCPIFELDGSVEVRPLAKLEAM